MTKIIRKKISSFADSSYSFYKKHKNLYFFIAYSLIFAVLAAFVFSFFLINQKSFVWESDGLRQHYSALTYFGIWGREIIKGLFSGQGLSVPLWDFSMGYGSDVLTTLHYYVIGDPLNLLSIVTPSEYTEYLYIFLILVRIYLSGLFFGCFCFRMKKGLSPALAGAITYAFCDFVLFAAVRHPFFMNPMVYLPLLFIGAERILNKEKPYLFIFMVFISAMSSFYFFYMLAIAVAVYSAVRVLTLYKENLLKNIVCNILKIGGSAVVGVMISAFIFLPVVMLFLGDSRSSVSNAVDLFYNELYYQKFISNFISTGDVGYWCHLGFSAFSLLGVFMLFKKAKKHLPLIIVFTITTVFLLMPVFGHIFNGFSYVTNRWNWAYAFIVAYILSSVWNELFMLSRKDKVYLITASALYVFSVFLFDSARSEKAFASIAVLLISLCILVSTDIGKLSSKMRHAFECVIIGLICASVFINSLYLYSVQEGTFLSKYIDIGNALSLLENTTDKAVKNAAKEDKDFYRFSELEGSNYQPNAPIISRLNSIKYYWSLGNGSISNFLMDMENREYSTFGYRGVDERTFLETLACVKYYVTEGKKPQYVPYGFKFMKQVDVGQTEYCIYENKHSLPFGYTYSTYIPSSDYENMTAVQKQEALLQGIVLENGENLEKTKAEFSSEYLTYSVKCDSGVKYSKNSFTVDKKKAAATLTFDCPKDCELYLEMLGFDFEAENPGFLYSEAKWNELSKYDQNKQKGNEKVWTEPTNVSLNINSGKVTKKLLYRTADDQFYNEKEDYLINLCSSTDKRTRIKITFPREGTYYFSEMNVISQPFDNYENQVSRLTEDVLEDVEFGTNEVKGTISLDRDKMLCLSIPYCKGWTAYIDDRETELYCANSMYTAVYAEKGTHSIVLKYRTPGLKEGFIVSCMGLTAFVLIAVFMKIKDKKRKNINS